jgi:hypothetical protein
MPLVPFYGPDPAMVKALFAKVLSRKMPPSLGPNERLLTTHASNPTRPPVPEPVKMNYITPVAAVEQHVKEQVRETQKYFPRGRQRRNPVKRKPIKRAPPKKRGTSSKYTKQRTPKIEAKLMSIKRLPKKSK